MPNIDVETCDSAFEALGRIRDVAFDAIVTDIKMPGMDGLSLLAAVQERQPDTPTLLISGHGEHDLTIRALRGGAYDFIQKPIDREYFVAALSRALDLRGLRRQLEEQRRLLELHATELEATVEKRTRELVKATEAKDEFLGMISHEMRTPLTVLNGGVHLLRRRSLDRAEMESVLRDMEREGARLLRIIEDLLALAHASLREEAGREPLSVPALLKSIVASLESRTERPILLELGDGLPFVEGDAGYVERVLENLVSNCVKYAAPNEPIIIRAAHERALQLSITVCDRGEVVAPAVAERLFDRFYRARTTADKAQGAGIGLTVCRRLVEALGGEIWARPRDGGGLEVTFTLPVLEDSTLEVGDAPALYEAVLPSTTVLDSAAARL